MWLASRAMLPQIEATLRTLGIATTISNQWKLGVTQHSRLNTTALCGS